MNESIKKEIYSWLKSLAFGLLIVVICRNFIFAPTVVNGESMEPTFADQDRVLISKISDIQRFDLVVFQAPDEGNKDYVKRVIGLPGDTLEMINDTLYINGKAFDEPYLEVAKRNVQPAKLTGDFTLKEITGVSVVPQGSVFVLGDNRLISKDSRSFGFVPIHTVEGVVKLRFYPFDVLGFPR